MDFQEALSLQEKNKHLLGKKDKGLAISELILVPTDANLAEKYCQLYIKLLDGEKAAKLIWGADVNVVAVFDKEKIAGTGIFQGTDILLLSPELEVNKF